MSVVFSVFDRVSGTYGSLVNAPNCDCAKRDIKVAVMRNSLMESSIQDYDLVVFGSFDERSGELSVYPTPEIIPVSSLVVSPKGVDSDV